MSLILGCTKTQIKDINETRTGGEERAEVVAMEADLKLRVLKFGQTELKDYADTRQGVLSVVAATNSFALTTILLSHNDVDTIWIT
jgi:hypothetical protein